MSELINSIMNMGYFETVIINLLIAYLLYRFIKKQKKEYPEMLRIQKNL